MIFLSTPSARRATEWRFQLRPGLAFLSTPSARRATYLANNKDTFVYKFLSTPSARRATRRPRGAEGVQPISIHALREEGDRPGKSNRSRSGYFYPRPPRGGRPAVYNAMIAASQFLSTPSARRATLRNEIIKALKEDISIHALREEGDPGLSVDPGSQSEFLSTPSARRATDLPFAPSPVKIFLSTPSARRATPSTPAPRIWERNFYPRPPRGGRQQKQRQNLYFLINYTTFCTNLEEP